MNKRTYYLVTALDRKGNRMNLCVTNRREHANSVVADYADRQAKFTSITDVKALEIISNNIGCQVAMF